MGYHQLSRGSSTYLLMGSQVGKSGASFMAQAMLLTLGSIPAAMPTIFGVFTVICLAWLRAVAGLNTDINKQETDKAEAKEAKAAAEGAGEGGAAAAAAAV